MITIILGEAFGKKFPRIDITNDTTFEEVRIECRDHDEEREILIQVIKELLKNED